MSGGVAVGAGWRDPTDVVQVGQETASDIVGQILRSAGESCSETGSRAKHERGVLGPESGNRQGQFDRSRARGWDEYDGAGLAFVLEGFCFRQRFIAGVQRAKAANFQYFGKAVGKLGNARLAIGLVE